MAERAKAKRARAKRRATGNGARGIGDNSGTIPPEVIQRHWAQIGTAQKAYDAAHEAMKKKKSALSNCFKAAKADGIDPDAMREARRLDEGDHAHAVLHFREVGHILEVVESDLPLFRDINIPPAVNAYLAGQQAGRNAEPADNNPHAPGSEEFARWNEGHASGIDTAAEGLRTGTVPAPPQ